MDQPKAIRSRKTRWRRLRAAVGLLIWASLLGGGLTALKQDDQHSQALERMGQQLFGHLEVVTVRFPLSARLGRGSRLRVEQGESLFQAGEVLSWEQVGDHKVAEVAVYPEYREWLGADAGFVAYETSGDIQWIIKTLFPAKIREEVFSILARRWKEQREFLLRELRPGLIRLGDDLARALRDDFPRILKENREEMALLGTVLKERAWDGHVRASFQDEIWPLVQERATPMVSEIGEELIEAFPLFDFSWSYLLQKINFSDNDRLQKELRAFMTKKGVPILKSHDKEFQAAAIKVLMEVVANPKTQSAFERAFSDVAHDERFRSAVTKVLGEWLIENQAVHEIMNGIWERDDLRRPLERFLDRLTPDIHRIANKIVLNDAGDGIDPELARVLRRKILREDERWVLLTPSLQKLSAQEPLSEFSGKIGGIR